MSKSSRILVVLFVVLAGSSTLYQAVIVKRQAGEIAEFQTRLNVAEAAERRAVRETANVSRQLIAAMQSTASPANSSSNSAVSPATSQPDGTVSRAVLVGPDGGIVQAGAGATPVIEFRAPPLDPAVLIALPTPEAFEKDFFQGAGTVASWPELIMAGIGLRTKAAGVAEYMSTHAVLAGLVDSLKETSTLLQKDTGSNPEITRTLQENYAATTAKMVGLARAIAERPNERPDAVEVSKQIEDLGKVIQGRLPPEFQAQVAITP